MRYFILFAIILLVIIVAYPIYSILRIKRVPSQSFTVPQTSWEIPEQKLFEHVKYLSRNIGSRSFGEPLKISATRDYILKTLSQDGMNPSIQDFTIDNMTFSNVVLTFTGLKYPREVVVIGAHYDTILGTPGADDNGSAVAMLLETARMLGNAELSRTLKLVFFVLEEPPIFGTENMGSRIFARRAKEAGMDIRAMISLEMVGFFSEDKGKQAFPLPLMNLFYSTTPNFIAVVGNFRSRALVSQVADGLKKGCMVPVEVLAAPAIVPGIGLSDHASFWKEGYPAVMITDSAFYRNPNYHQATDTFDTLDYKTMAELLKGLIYTVRVLCGGDIVIR